ncbi:Hypothetical protein SMAX5B_019062 [Scophthalmus maximus]|uniref:Uncharacterized protein n=1 Tax=Scophthalmus maximus TaxID=52904 RepID=A0A2U9C528_SCOMX|nr:Hypothetical protein SMAX5B_019062 [Scophthalmus maximus]
MRETQQKVQRIRRTEQRSPSFLVNRESILHSVISENSCLLWPKHIAMSVVRVKQNSNFVGRTAKQ